MVKPFNGATIKQQGFVRFRLTSRQNVKESKPNRPLAAPIPQKDSNNQPFDITFCIDFQHVPEWLKFMKSMTGSHFQWF